jgi:hypothetical protein
MATSDKYKRGSSGYSIEDEKNAKRYSKLVRAEAQDASMRKNWGEKGYSQSFDQDEVEARTRTSERNYKDNLSSAEGRDVNKRNMDFMEQEVNKIRAANSRAQYEHEKAAGDPYATEMSFEDWKKL